jgi:ABC-2 type transport system permease protein
MTIAMFASTPVASRRSALRTVARLTVAELRLVLREPMVAIGLLGFPLVTMLVIAGVFGQVPDPEFGGVAPDDHYIAGYVGVVLGALGVITIPVLLATNRELGVTRRYRASGVSAPVLVATRVLLGIVLGTASVAGVLVTGSTVYGMASPDDLGGVVLWYGVGLLCFIAIGLAVGELAPTGRSANAAGNLLFVPMFLLGGGGPPRDVMSGAMRTVSDVLPLTHIVGGLRESWLGTTDDPHLMWWPVAVALCCIVVAVGVAARRAS